MYTDYTYVGWLVAVHGVGPTSIYAALCDDPDAAVEAVAKRRGNLQESYKAVGRLIDGLEMLRNLSPGDVKKL